MRGKRSSLSMILPVLALLSWHGCAQAFAFCFSFGGRDNHRAHYNDYLPPPPGSLRGLYGVYPYSPAPVYSGYGGYYSLPYGTPAAGPAPGDPGSGAYRE
jgi:hypothetical protein